MRPSLKSVPGTELSLHTKLDELEFVILDTETTVLRPRTDRLVEVGVVHLGRDREPKLVFDSLLNPERDVGPTSIHGIRAEDVLRAPKFGAVVGELVEQTRHGVWVGHNLPFDTRMLGGELARLGGTVTPGAYICTMQLARQLPLGVKGHRLTWLCEEFGIDLQEAHAAGNDAMATAQLLLRLLELAEKEGMQTLGDMSSVASGALIWQLPQPLPPRADPFPREFARGDALRERATFIQSLVLELPAPEAGDPELDPAAFCYLDLIDRVLMDRRIDLEEQMLIHQLTRDWQIRRDVAEKVHRHYLRRLVRQAWSDHILTPAEQEDLELVAGLLAIPSAELQAMSTEEEAQVRVQPIPEPLRGRSHFAGKSVCLIGHFKGPHGVGLPRAEAAALARKHGVQVKDGVSKKVDALVLADPNSQSGKAKKARAYGIDLVAEHVFWKDLGLA